ncbi:MAG: Ig-like domain repeat protein [Hyphomicrobiaceae bacterium]
MPRTSDYSAAMRRWLHFGCMLIGLIGCMLAWQSSANAQSFTFDAQNGSISGSYPNFTITGPDSPCCSQQTSSYVGTFSTATTVTFTWSYSTTDGVESSGYILNGTQVELIPLFQSSGSGSVTVAVPAGGTLGWYVTALDSCCGPGVLTVSASSSSPLATTLAASSTTLTVGSAATPFTPVTASGGTGTLSYAVNPGLPAGLSLNTATGQITGTPTAVAAAGNYTVTVTDQTAPTRQTSDKTFSLAVSPVSTSTAVTSSPNPSLLGQSVVLTATITPAFAGGTASFKDGATVLCNAVPIVNGVATCTTSFTSAGAHVVSAAYSGSPAYANSTSEAITHIVGDQRRRTVEAIGRFLGARNNQILSNEPNTQRQIDRLIEFGDGPVGGQTGTPATLATFSANQQGAMPSRLGAGPDARDISRMRFGRRDTLLGGATGGIGADGGGAGGMFSLGYGGPYGLGLAGSFGSLEGWQEFSTAAASSGGGAAQLGGARVSGNADGPMSLGFATSLRDINRAAADAEARKMTESGLAYSGAAGPTGAPQPNPFDIWIEGKYASLSSGADLDGNFGLLSVGADYVLNRALLVGTLVQFDSMQQRSASEVTEVKGHGWMAGPYATLRLDQNLFWQARAAWGRSSNEVSPFRTYTDQFDTERWLATSALSGRWHIGPLSFRPSVSVSYTEDVAKSYVDTFDTLIPEVKSKLGQAKAGPEISYQYVIGRDLVITPHVGLQVIWNFVREVSADGFGNIDDDVAGPSGVRGRAELGIRASTSGGIGLDISGSYDGIGSSDYSAVTGRAAVRIQLQ